MMGPRMSALIIDFLALYLLLAEKGEPEDERAHTPT